MYHGWVGSPEILHRVVPGVVDGEMSYQVTFYEMFCVSLVAATVAMIVVRSKVKRLRK